MPEQQGQYSSADIEPRGQYSAADITPTGVLNGIGQGVHDVVGGITSLPHVLAHPLDTLDQISQQQSQLGQRAVQDAKTGHYGNAVWHGIDAAIPVLGPMDAQLTDQYQGGDKSGAMARGVVNAAPFAIPHALPAAANAMESAAKVVSPNVSRMMNRFIQLHANDVPKYGRLNPANYEDVGSAVYKHAGLKNNLPAQQQAIVEGLDKLKNEQAGIIQNASSQPIDVQHLLFDKAGELQDELRKAEGETPRVNAVGNNWDALHQQYGTTSATTAQALEMRNNLRGRITDWNPKTQNVEQRYLQDVYHGLNDEVKKSLTNPDERAKWQSNNQDMHNLIIANDSAKEALRNKTMQFEGPIKKSAKVGKAINPSKWSELIPENLDRRAAMAPSQALRAGSGVARLAGNSDLNRILQAPLLTPRADDDQQ